MTPDHLDILLDEAVGRGTPAVIRMNATEYADVRKWGRDVLDIEIRVEYLRKGLQAQYKSVQIQTTRLLPPGIAEVLDEDGCGLVHMVRLDRFGPGHVHPGSYSVCESDSACLVLYVMNA